MTNSSAWVSAPAVAWVLDRAPNVPPELVAPLIAIARRADLNGRNAHPSSNEISRVTRKSLRQVKRDISQLKKLGLIIPGDPSATSYLPPGKRPENYDIPVWTGDIGDIGQTDEECRPRHPRGVTHDTGRGDTDDTVGVSPMTPKESSNPSSKTDQSSSRLANAITDVCARLGLSDEDEAKKVIENRRAKTRSGVTAIDRFIAAMPNEDLWAALDEVRSGVAAMPNWCGRCDERTRLKEQKSTFGEWKTIRCGTCNPDSPDYQQAHGTSKYQPYRNPEDQDSYDDWQPHSPADLDRDTSKYGQPL